MELIEQFQTELTNRSNPLYQNYLQNHMKGIMTKCVHSKDISIAVEPMLIYVGFYVTMLNVLYRFV